MLIQKLNQINQVLDSLINITEDDIKYIKDANHEKLFQNISIKEELAEEFNILKKDIDTILVNRNKPIEEIFSKEEEVLFDQFKEKLNNFYSLHKRFSKLSLSVANFYNSLLSQIKEEKKISYKDSDIKKSYLRLKA